MDWIVISVNKEKEVKRKVYYIMLYMVGTGGTIQWEVNLVHMASSGIADGDTNTMQ